MAFQNSLICLNFVQLSEARTSQNQQKWSHSPTKSFSSDRLDKWNVLRSEATDRQVQVKLKIKFTNSIWLSNQTVSHDALTFWSASYIVRSYMAEKQLIKLNP